MCSLLLFALVATALSGDVGKQNVNQYEHGIHRVASPIETTRTDDDDYRKKRMAIEVEAPEIETIACTKECISKYKTNI